MIVAWSSAIAPAIPMIVKPKSLVTQALPLMARSRSSTFGTSESRPRWRVYRLVKAGMGDSYMAEGDVVYGDVWWLKVC